MYKLKGTCEGPEVLQLTRGSADSKDVGRSNSNTWSNTARHHRAWKRFPFISSPSDSRPQTHIQQAHSQFFPIHTHAHTPTTDASRSQWIHHSFLLN